MTIPLFITCIKDMPEVATSASADKATVDGQSKNIWAPPTYRVTYCSGELEPINLPEAFIPPRHCFSRPSKVNNQSGSSILKSTENAGLIWELEPYDIICGRGAPSKFSEGNQRFRDLVGMYQTSYICARRSEKPRIAKELLKTIHSRGGRFLKRHTRENGRAAWAVVGEQQAYEKVCQALRDGAPELRRQMVACSAIRSYNINKENNSRPNNSTFQPINIGFCQDDRDKENYTPIPCW